MYDFTVGCFDSSTVTDQTNPELSLQILFSIYLSLKCLNKAMNCSTNQKSTLDPELVMKDGAERPKLCGKKPKRLTKI